METYSHGTACQVISIKPIAFFEYWNILKIMKRISSLLILIFLFFLYGCSFPDGYADNYDFTVNNNSSYDVMVTADGNNYTIPTMTSQVINMCGKKMIELNDKKRVSLTRSDFTYTISNIQSFYCYIKNNSTKKIRLYNNYLGDVANSEGYEIDPNTEIKNTLYSDGAGFSAYYYEGNDISNYQATIQVTKKTLNDATVYYVSIL